jgi:hypothetical protein
MTGYGLWQADNVDIEFQGRFHHGACVMNSKGYLPAMIKGNFNGCSAVRLVGNFDNPRREG